MAFKKLDLDSKILQAIEACGYNKPTPVQSKAIPHILNGKDIVASAQTGTGKTAAYVLPALQLLATTKHSKKPRILILAPTRELAGQITKVIGKYAKFMKVNIASFVGGESYQRQFKQLSRPLDIVIATPGRLMDHMENKRLDLSGIEMLIVDEADRMLDMGFIDDIKTIVRATPKKRQTLLFSATAEDKLLSIVNNLLTNPVRINISEERIDTTLIKQKIYIVKKSDHKKSLLGDILDGESIYKAIIFSSTKRNAAKLALEMNEHGYKASPMHGDLKQSARNRTLEQFRKGAVQFLVATDVAARGIDVTDISHVINYDLPRFVEDYVHRIGRTGRAGKTGLAISIALHSEAQLIRKIERYIDDKIQTVQMTEDGEQDIVLRSEHAKSSRQKPSDRKNYRKKPSRSGGKSTDSKGKPKYRGEKSDSKRKPKRRGPKPDSTSKSKRHGPKSDSSSKPKRRRPKSDVKNRSGNKPKRRSPKRD